MFWGWFGAACAAAIVVGYAILLSFPSARGGKDDAVRGGWWTALAFLLVAVSQVPLISLTACRILSLVGCVLVFVSPWLQRRIPLGSPAPRAGDSISSG